MEGCPEKTLVVPRSQQPSKAGIAQPPAPSEVGQVRGQVGVQPTKREAQGAERGVGRQPRLEVGTEGRGVLRPVRGVPGGG